MVKYSKAIFLDRDGVINKPIIYKHKPYSPRLIKEFKLIKNVKKAIKILKLKGYKIIIITNQPDAKLNSKIKKKIISINNKTKNILKIDKIYSCFHTDQDNCQCRKPKIGNILKAKKKFKINLKKSYFVGDRWKDIEAGRSSNCKTIFINYNYKEKKPKKYFMKVRSLYEFSKKI